MIFSFEVDFENNELISGYFEFEMYANMLSKDKEIVFKLLAIHTPVGLEISGPVFLTFNKNINTYKEIDSIESSIKRNTDALAYVGSFVSNKPLIYAPEVSIPYDKFKFEFGQCNRKFDYGKIKLQTISSLLSTIVPKPYLGYTAPIAEPRTIDLEVLNTMTNVIIPYLKDIEEDKKQEFTVMTDHLRDDTVAKKKITIIFQLINIS